MSHWGVFSLTRSRDSEFLAKTESERLRNDTMKARDMRTTLAVRNWRDAAQNPDSPLGCCAR